MGQCSLYYHCSDIVRLAISSVLLLGTNTHTPSVTRYIDYIGNYRLIILDCIRLRNEQSSQCVCVCEEIAIEKIEMEKINYY